MNFDFNRLYLSTEGRIGRGQYWLGAVVLAVITIIVTFLVTRALGGTAYIIFALIWQIIISYLAYNLMAKRFQDRDKPSTYALYAIVALFILTVISLFTTPPPGEMPRRHIDHRQPADARHRHLAADRARHPARHRRPQPVRA